MQETREKIPKVLTEVLGRYKDFLPQEKVNKLQTYHDELIRNHLENVSSVIRNQEYS